MSGRGAARGGGRGGRGPSGGASRGGGGRGPGRSDAGRGRTDAGRGRTDAGRGGGRGGQSGGRGGPGGGRGRGPPAPQGPTAVKEVSTNVVQASISESCFFYMIGLDGQDKKGEQIDSPSRRAFLFVHGLRKLLKDLPEAESKFYMRVSFVQGSTAFCGRKIPNLEEELLLCDGTDTGGDTLRIVRIERFAVPECLTLPADATPAAAGGLKIDQFRCQGSAQTFSSYQDLLQHCGDTGDSPIVIQDGEEVKPAEPAVFLAYINCALQRAMGEILTRWGQDYFDPKEFTEDWGIKIFRAIHMSFSLGRVGGSKSTSLLLTCDLKAKVMRCRSLLDEVNERRQTQVPANIISAAKRKWINSGNSVIYKSDRKRYDVVGLHFDKSPDTLPLGDKTMSHTAYFKSKGITLEFPHCPPMVEVKGRRDMSIFLPPELVFEFELDPKTKMKLPQITSFDPPSRHEAINKALKDLTPPRLVLTPGSKKSIGGSLLPALGIVLKDSRVNLKTLSLPFPSLVAPNVEIFKNEQFSIAKAKYNVDPKQATTLQVVLFYNEYIQGFEAVYGQLRDLVNGMNTKYRFPAKPVAVVETNTNEQHFGAVERFFAGKAPANVFVLDFANPSRGATDLAYPVIKHTLGKGGYLSQFVNWKTCAHDDSSQERKSSPILQGVARQIIQKTGVCLWYVSLPVEVPLPAMFLGIDVFHAPIVFDPKSKKKGRKNSVVAFVFSVIEKFPQKGHPVVTRTYTKTCRRDPGEEVNLADVLEKAVKEATQAMAIQPASLFVYRDGMNETSARHEKAELAGVRKGLTQNPVGGQQVAATVPVAYVNCQKRVANKFLTVDGQFAAPAGTLITGLQGMTHKTFYINNNAPRGSTGKPTRFELVSRDAALKAVNVEALTYSLCYTYPNWTGLIKVPGPVQCAHKAAELAGCMIDGGESINAKAFTNTCYYL